MRTAEAAHVRKGVGIVYTLHDEGAYDGDLRFAPLPLGASTVVLTVTGVAPDLTPQVSFDSEEWFPLVSSDIRTRAAYGRITAAGAYVFDTTGWLFFSVVVGAGCVCAAKATVTQAAAPSAGVISASGAPIADLQVLLDEASSTVLYVGQAVLGSATSAAFWRMRRITTSGTVTTVAYADGNANFDNVWDNRASLSYS